MASLEEQKLEKVKDDLAVQKQELKEQKKLLEDHKKEVKELVKQEKNLRTSLANHGKQYVSESKKAVSAAVLAAFAFLMALSWREYINEVFSSFLQYSPVQSTLITAVLVTILSVIGIILVNRYLHVDE